MHGIAGSALRHDVTSAVGGLAEGIRRSTERVQIRAQGAKPSCHDAVSKLQPVDFAPVSRCAGLEADAESFEALHPDGAFTVERFATWIGFSREAANRHTRGRTSTGLPLIV